MHFVGTLFKRKYFLFLFSVFFLGGIFLAFNHVSAQAGNAPFGLQKVGSLLPLGGEDIRVIAAKIIRIALSLLGIIAVALILYAGFTWMTSGGNEEKIASAKKTLINATIGLAIIMSSFAITQFIISRLAMATGSGGLVNDGGGVRGGVPACANFADCQAVAGGPRECGDDAFVVKSLTPRTPTNSGTGMSNTIVRAVFSRPLDENQDKNKIFKLSKGSNTIPVKSIKILPGRQVVEAFFGEDTNLCNADGDTRSCLSPGEYKVEVNPDLVAGGLKLQTKLACGIFDTTSLFNVNRDFLDLLSPITDSITFNGKNTREGQIVPRNAKYHLNATFEDRRKEDGQNISFGGISYLALNVQSEPRDPAGEKVNWSYYSGPRSGSNEAFSLNQDLVFASDASVPALYNLTFTVADIDHNITVATSSFVLDGDLCHNGRQDAGETAIDIGGKCLGDGACNANWQCVSGDCQNGSCVNRPIIRDVDVGGASPSSWDGAPGSWATILGNFFGEDSGSVDFGIDNNADGSIDQWVPAPFASCNGLDVWHDNMVIVEIPNLPVGTSTTIRIKTRAAGDKPAYEDLSNDDHGPKAGPNAGIFKMSNNDHPGLCAVLGPTNTNIASSSAPVTAFGRGLGNGGNNSALLFGGVNAPIRQWNEATILSSVPQNMSPGRVGVRAKIGDSFTNGVEFIVVDRDADLVPHIDALSPSQTSTLGSLLTISGARFGGHGVVYIAASADAALNCARTSDAAVEAACARLDLATLPEACGDTWSDNQIIGKIPSGIQLGKYYVVVKNDSNHHSDGTSNITFLPGNPLPGLCRINPNIGVAPLPNNASPLILTGINLTQNPELYFWSINSRWLTSSNNKDPLGNNVIRRVSNDGTTIETVLPVDNTGVSMITGPILARAGNEFSNSVQYNVADCTLGGDAPGVGYQCCTNGPEKGLWKPQAFACVGETRSAGYVWRFTTGLIPHVPRVLEACNIADWQDLNIDNFVRPSPSPWQNWGVGDACTDSIITVQFNMHMSEVNLNSAVRVYTCGQGDKPDCKYLPADDVTGQYSVGFLGGNQTDILELRLAPGASHRAGTWHRVILGNTLHANEPGLVEFGNNKINTSPLSLQRTLPAPVNGITAAYNFDFKTSNAACSLFGAAITPPEYTTHLLGMVQNPAFPLSDNFDAPAHPFYYFVWGRGSQACSVVDVNGKGFEWKPRQGNEEDLLSDMAYAVRSDKKDVPTTSSLYADSIRATVTALKNTANDPVVITASADTVVDGVHKVVTGSSNLFIQPGDPKAVQWWPQCNQSCTNVNIGVRFNLPMKTNTYHGALKVQKCAGPLDIGENCQNPEAPLAFHDVNAAAFDPFQYEITVDGTLDVNTLYQVTLTDQVIAFGGTLGGQAIDGKAVAPKVWKFRTKEKDGICILDKVDVVPSPFVASLVGQKTAYGASPLSAPDQCSPLGQRLNPWAYGWNWTVLGADDLPVNEAQQVATTTGFSTKGSPYAYCSGNCLPAGSDIPFGQIAYLCGNSQVDPGEDCDVATLGEIPGVSCTLNCLRPGNIHFTTSTDQSVLGLCGNAVLEPNFGEECDPGIPGEKDYCTNTCTWKGSSQKFSDAVGSLQCGNGKVGLADGGLALLGEDCDLGISLAEAGAHPSWSALGCSENCLHLGTKMARAYCEAPLCEAANCPANHSNLTRDQKQSSECLNSATICGDGNLDPGEECEKTTEPRHIKVVLPNGNIDLIEVASASTTCTNRCVLQNICDIKANISSDFSCESGTAGCNSDCTKHGSSGLYDTPSLCGNGLPELGENPRCEPANLVADPGFDQDPIQVVTAIGQGLVNPLTLMQEAKVQVQATQVRKNATTTESLRARNIIGKGDYSLQCGYVEYPTPIVENGVARSNNCPDANQGVGTNSCCQARPTRTSELPLNGTGIGEVVEANKVCRNSLIAAEFNREIDEKTISNSVLVASLHPAGYVCASANETEVTSEIGSLLALSGGEQVPGLFARIWSDVKQFFVDVFNSVVHAEVGVHLVNMISNKGTVWCTGKIVPKIDVIPLEHVGAPTTTRMNITVNDLLEANTIYAVVLRGGNSGIRDINGVGIQGNVFLNNNNRFHTDDIFVFETGSQICRVQDVDIDPSSYLFTRPNTNHDFVASVKSTTGALIVSTPSYAWQWSWEPRNNSLFTFPAIVNTDRIRISSKDLEGTIVASAQIAITADTTNVETGRVFAGLSNLTAMFCENPWPTQITYPYEDGVSLGAGNFNNDHFNLSKKIFDGASIPKINLGGKLVSLNFSTGYCADSGNSGDKTDDLPLLRPMVQGNLAASVGHCSVDGKVCHNVGECRGILAFNQIRQQQCLGVAPAVNSNLPEGTLKKFLFFNDKNDDVIGIQVFANGNRSSAREWFIEQGFSGIEKYRDIIVDGYDAISDGNNTYINVLNELEDKTVHNYIYLIGINSDAQANTRQVLEKFMAHFIFNINISERQSCLSGNGDAGQYVPANINSLPVSSVSCTNDFECRTILGTPTSTTNGICANAKSKFQRDWSRLNTIQNLENKIEDYRSANGTYPLLPAGTYIPGYTNTHWPSWGRLLTAVGNVAEPELNQWSACGHCEALQNGRQVACSTDTDCGAAPAKCILPDDSQTCWNSTDATFSCPAQSSVLEYKGVDANHYSLYLPLEYFDMNNANQRGIIQGMVSTTHYSTSLSSCGEQGLEVLRPVAGNCGNGIRDIGEACDPPGTSSVAGGAAGLVCGQGETAYHTCNAACQYDAPVCRANANCGNGHIDAGETCDDGNLNGSYGHCSLACTPPGPQNDAAHINAGFCGDAIINFNDQNHNGVKDPNEASLENCDKADPAFVNFGYCKKSGTICIGPNFSCPNVGDTCVSVNDPTYYITQQLSCSLDCQARGGYCGDSILQISDETCDDGNTNRLDGCSKFCQVENIACAQQIPQAQISIDHTDPTSHFDRNAPGTDDTLVKITYNDQTTSECINTTGDAICRGFGLECQSVAKRNIGVVGDLGWVALAGDQCAQILNSSLNKDVRIHCDGLRPNVVAEVAVAGSCGNAVVDAGEVCDTGASNGQACESEYGRTCTYCSGDCKKVLTQDPLDSCGNGKIDIDSRLSKINNVAQPEVCDIDPVTNQVIIPGGNNAPANANTTALRIFYNNDDRPAICADRGTYTCENNCQNLVTNCVSCTTSDNRGKATPKIAVLNVLTPQDINNPGANNVNTSWANSVSRYLLRVNSKTSASGVLALGGSEAWKNENVFIQEDPSAPAATRWHNYEMGVNTTDYNQSFWLLSNIHNFPFARDYGYKTSARQAGPWSANKVTIARGLETNLLCSDQYATYFNLDDVTADKFNGNRSDASISTKLSVAGAKEQYERYGSFFPYPVNAELTTIANEFVLSPAVPQGTFRVVVKWKHFADGPDVSFAPVIYNRDFLGNAARANATTEQRFAASVDVLKALSSNRANRGRNFLCSRMTSVYNGLNNAEIADLARLNIFNYWQPDACEDFYGNPQDLITQGSVFVHDSGTLQSVSAQASTIITGDSMGLLDHGYYNSPYAVFVEVISGSSTVPISAFDNLDVTVEIYEYRADQIPESSLYLPTHVYTLRSATASANAGIAKYWHVFNLVKNANRVYEVRQIHEAGFNTEFPNGAVDTSFADVLCRVPGEPCNRER